MRLHIHLLVVLYLNHISGIRCAKTETDDKIEETSLRTPLYPHQVGLVNHQYNCYMNALFSCLYSIPFFQSTIYEIIESIQELPQKHESTLVALADIFVRMRKHRSALSTVSTMLPAVKKLMNWKVGDYQCVLQFWDEFTATMPAQFQQIFTVKVENNYIRKSDGVLIKSIADEGSYINIPAPSAPVMLSSLIKSNFLDLETEDYKIEPKDQADYPNIINEPIAENMMIPTKSTIVIKNSPNVLAFGVKRLGWNRNTQEAELNTVPIHFDLITVNGDVYSPCCAIIFSTNHYYAIIRDRVSNRYFMHNDTKVEYLDHNAPEIRSFIQNVIFTQSAMMFYVKESAYVELVKNIRNNEEGSDFNATLERLNSIKKTVKSKNKRKITDSEESQMKKKIVVSEESKKEMTQEERIEEDDSDSDNESISEHDPALAVESHNIVDPKAFEIESVTRPETDTEPLITAVPDNAHFEQLADLDLGIYAMSPGFVEESINELIGEDEAKEAELLEQQVQQQRERDASTKLNRKNIVDKMALKKLREENPKAAVKNNNKQTSKTTEKSTPQSAQTGVSIESPQSNASIYPVFQQQETSVPFIIQQVTPAPVSTTPALIIQHQGIIGNLNVPQQQSLISHGVDQYYLLNQNFDNYRKRVYSPGYFMGLENYSFAEGQGSYALQMVLSALAANSFFFKQLCKVVKEGEEMKIEYAMAVVMVQMLTGVKGISVLTLLYLIKKRGAQIADYDEGTLSNKILFCLQALSNALDRSLMPMASIRVITYSELETDEPINIQSSQTGMYVSSTNDYIEPREGKIPGFILDRKYQGNRLRNVLTTSGMLFPVTLNRYQTDGQFDSTRVTPKQEDYAIIGGIFYGKNAQGNLNLHAELYSNYLPNSLIYFNQYGGLVTQFDKATYDQEFSRIYRSIEQESHVLFVVKREFWKTDSILGTQVPNFLLNYTSRKIKENLYTSKLAHVQTSQPCAQDPAVVIPQTNSNINTLSSQPNGILTTTQPTSSEPPTEVDIDDEYLEELLKYIN